MPTPQIPDERLANIAQWAISRMAHSERALVAERVLGAAGQRVRDPRVRADILMDGAEARLAKGHVPRHLTKAYVARLERADEEHAAGRWAAAGSETTRALLLAYHRVLHVDGLSSPLAEHPA
ncbi:MAG TPA: glycosyltransferase family 1 protein, partial [Streptomyces sp.]